MKIEININKFGFKFSDELTSIKNIFNSEIATIIKLPEECPYCKAKTELALEIRGEDLYEYYVIKCTGSRVHKSDLGEYNFKKSGKEGLYYKGDWYYYDYDKKEVVGLELVRTQAKLAKKEHKKVVPKETEPKIADSIKYAIKNEVFANNDEAKAAYNQIKQELVRKHGVWGVKAWNDFRQQWYDICNNKKLNVKAINSDEGKDYEQL